MIAPLRNRLTVSITSTASRALLSRHCFSTSPAAWRVAMPPRSGSGETVELAFENFESAKEGKRIETPAESVVVCHGLFGSKQNWRSIAKSMAQQWGLPVYAIDLRNHGTSPHIVSMDYADMAADVQRFLVEKQLSNVALIGHSMGGKTVQALALSPSLPEAQLSHLISVDMAPARGPISKEFETYVDAMLRIEEQGCSSRSQADKVLQEIEPDAGVRAFLLTNLTRLPSSPDSVSSEHWGFRIPVRSIKEHLQQIGDFPYDPPRSEDTPEVKNDGRERPSRSWEGRTMFVKGAQSKYINRRNIPVCDAYFPNAQHATLETGHWVQAEKPREFVQLVREFLER